MSYPACVEGLGKYVYGLIVILLLCTVLVNLESVLFLSVWSKRASMVRRKICDFHHLTYDVVPLYSVLLGPRQRGQADQRVPKTEAQSLILRHSFQGRMCAHHDENGEFWKEDVKKAFPTLRNVHLKYEETHGLLRNECPFYHKCRYALKVFFRLPTGLSDNLPLSW